MDVGVEFWQQNKSKFQKMAQTDSENPKMSYIDRKVCTKRSDVEQLVCEMCRICMFSLFEMTFELNRIQIVNRNIFSDS